MTQPMFDHAHYRWKDDPVDGEYELQLDRLETSKEGERFGQAVLLIVDTEADEIVGQVTLQTAAVSGLDRDEPNMTRIFDGTIEDGDIVALDYKPERSQKRHEEAQKRHDRIFGNTDDDSDG